MRRLVCISFFVLTACTPAQLAGLQTANTVATGVACGVAAANGVPCTPSAAVEALTESQRQLAEALAKAVGDGDEETIRAVLALLATCSESERALTEALAEARAAAKATAAPSASAATPATLDPVP